MGKGPLSNLLENRGSPIVSCVGSGGSGVFRKVYDEVKTRCNQPNSIGIQESLTGVQLSSHCANVGLSLQEGLQIVAQKWWQG